MLTYSGLTLPTPNPSVIRASQTTPFSTTAASFAAAKRHRLDPYIVRQRKLKRTANVARQQTLRAERREAMGHPVRSTETPFIRSLEDVYPTEIGATTTESSDSPAASSDLPPNHFVTSDELTTMLEKARFLSEPIVPENLDTIDPQQVEEAATKHKVEHAIAAEAVQRILQLDNGNAASRTRVNVQKCIERFGRHNTDEILPPKPGTLMHPEPSPPKQRAGPDTGSPEVQIAVLTTKIRALDNHLLTQGKSDKHNKKNLRVFVHKRQKLLKYLRREDRGGARFQNVMSTLGLSDAAWKGEISL